MLKGKIKKGSLLAEYIVSYLAIAVISCSLISILMYSLSFQSYYRLTELNINNKIDMALEDTDAQFEILQYIAYDVSIRIYYKPYYFRRNKYYEKELLRNLTQYVSSSPYSRNYFLYYRNDDIVYRSNDSTTKLTVLQKEINSANHPEISQILHTTQSEKYLSIDDALYVFLPIRTSGTMSSDSDAVLCFVIDKQTIIDRVQAITGWLPGEIAFISQGKEVVRWGDTTEKTYLTIDKYSPSSLFSISLQAARNQIIDNANWFTWLHRIMLILSFMLAASIAVYLGYNKYRPIKKLLSNRILPKSHQFNNELRELEWILHDLYDKEQSYSEQIKEHKLFIRDYILNLLIKEEYADDMDMSIEQFGVFQTRPFYCVILIAFDSTPDSSIQKLIEDLSDDDMSIYAIIKSDQIIVIASLNSERMKYDVFEMIEEVLHSGNYKFSMTTSEQCRIITDIKAIHYSYLEAENELKQQAWYDQEILLFGDIRDSELKTKSLMPMIRAIKTGDTKNAISFLQEIIDRIQEKNLEFSVQKNMLTSIVELVLKIALQSNISVPKTLTSNLVHSSDSDINYFKIQSIIQYICDSIDKTQITSEKLLAQNVVAYINDNYHEYDLCLEKLADIFQRSTGYLSRIIKQEIGESYVNHLTKLRINKAKSLLKEETQSVNSICEKVGYINVSHFIKMFKKSTGITPARYREYEHKSNVEQMFRSG